MLNTVKVEKAVPFYSFDAFIRPNKNQELPRIIEKLVVCSETDSFLGFFYPKEAFKGARMENGRCPRPNHALSLKEVHPFCQGGFIKNSVNCIRYSQIMTSF